MNLKKIVRGSVLIFLFICLSGTQKLEASFGGLDTVKVTGGNEITVTYAHTLNNNVYTSYSNLGGGLQGRTITGGVGNTGDNHIVLTFDGPPVALNTTGTIDIDNTVTWDDAEGGFLGTTGYVVSDGQYPILAPTVLYTPPGFGGITRLGFVFLEPMATTTITTSNIDSYLNVSNAHTFGTTGNGLEISWNTAGTILTVSLGSDHTVEDGDTIDPLQDVVDQAGNAVFNPGPITLLFSRPESVNFYYNAAVDNDWNTVGNWWSDENFTVPASSTPGAYDSVFIYGDVSNNTGTIPMVDSFNAFDSQVEIPLIVYNGAEFHGHSSYLGAFLLGDAEFDDQSYSGFSIMEFTFSTSHIIGNVLFNSPTTANYGTITGNASFYGGYGNAGLIFGNVDFNDNTSNPGVVTGNVIFRNNSFNANGTINGNADVYSPAENPLSGMVSGIITYHGYDNPFDGGSGTSGEDPYLISTCTQLQAMNDYLDSYFQLTQDIDCSESATWNVNLDEWVDGDTDNALIPDSYASTTHTSIIVQNNGYFGFDPIGDDENAFTGRLDGDNHTISNLWIFRKNSNQVGLFGETQNAHILRLGLSDSNIVGGASTGGLVGYMYGGETSDITLTNNMVRAYLNYNGGGLAGYVTESADVDNITNNQGTVHGSGSIIGGLIGRMEGSTLTDSNSSADVDGGYAIGGLIGQIDSGTISNSFATGNVVSNRSEYGLIKTGNAVGGFVGYMTGGAIDHSYASGDVNTAGDDAGGFVGYMNSGRIDFSHATGDVTGAEEGDFGTPNNIGGFAGNTLNDGIILSYDYSTGAAQTDGSSVGGFVGHSGCGTNMSYSYASGPVSGENYVGGFVGYDSCEGGSIYNVVEASGDVTSTGDYAGGFGGYMETSSVTNAYSSGNVTGVSNVGGFAGSVTANTNIQYAYSRGEVTGSEDNYGFTHIIENSSVEDSFFDSEKTGEVDEDGATPKTTAEMNTTSSFYTDAGWDFDAIWRRTEEANNGYPFFAFVLEPQVSSVTPADGATNVEATSTIVIHFSVPMEADFSPIISFSPCDGSCPSYTMTWSGNEQILTLTKIGEPFTYGTTYTITLVNAHSKSGFSLGGPEEWSFTIANEPTAPVVKTHKKVGGSSVGSRVKKLESWGKQEGADNLKKQFANIFNDAGNKLTTTPAGTSVSGPTSTTVRDLKLGLTGTDVKALQEILVLLNKGPAAVALKNNGTTQYFGSLTKAALIEYQKVSKIVPSVGYFGSLTRAQMKSSGVSGLWW
jgi:Bacterial Ig-like domain/The GLUG motif